MCSKSFSAKSSPSYHHYPAHPSSKRVPASIILDSVWYFPYERCDPFDLKCSFLVRFTHIYSACRLKRQWCIIYRFSPTVPRLLITTCVEDSANAAIQEFRSVVEKLRKELDNAFKNAEDLLENIGTPKDKGKETQSGDLLSTLNLLLVIQ